jgi:hypothetical protein
MDRVAREINNTIPERLMKLAAIPLSILVTGPSANEVVNVLAMSDVMPVGKEYNRMNIRVEVSSTRDLNKSSSDIRLDYLGQLDEDSYVRIHAQNSSGLRYSILRLAHSANDWPSDYTDECGVMIYATSVYDALHRNDMKSIRLHRMSCIVVITDKLTQSVAFMVANLIHDLGEGVRIAILDELNTPRVSFMQGLQQFMATHMEVSTRYYGDFSLTNIVCDNNKFLDGGIMQPYSSKKILSLFFGHHQSKSYLIDITDEECISLFGSLSEKVVHMRIKTSIAEIDEFHQNNVILPDRLRFRSHPSSDMFPSVDVSRIYESTGMSVLSDHVLDILSINRVYQEMALDMILGDIEDCNIEDYFYDLGGHNINRLVDRIITNRDYCCIDIHPCTYAYINSEEYARLTEEHLDSNLDNDLDSNPIDFLKEQLMRHLRIDLNMHNVMIAYKKDMKALLDSVAYVNGL